MSVHDRGVEQCGIVSFLKDAEAAGKTRDRQRAMNIAAMSGNSPAHARLVAATYEFSRMSLVVDVGGGHGRLLATILERYPRLRGILFEQPHVIEDARQILDEAGVGDRCDSSEAASSTRCPRAATPTSCAASIPGFEDDQAVAILTNCRRAMAAGARLLLMERYVATDPHEALPVACWRSDL